MTDGTTLAQHATETLSDFSAPPSAMALVDRIVQVGRYDRREAQRSVQIAIDRGLVRLGAGLRIETIQKPQSIDPMPNATRWLSEGGGPTYFRPTKLTVDTNPNPATVARLMMEE